MLRILIADDHTVVRKGLTQILHDMLEHVMIDEAENGNEVLEKIKLTPYDLIMMDISMPGRSGLETLKQIKKLYPAQKVLMLSIHPEDQYAIRSLKAGSSGYLTKATNPEELMRAINEILKGKKYVTSSVSEKLLSNLNDYGNIPPHEKLSDREYEVFTMIASGNTLSDISDELSLSVKTVSTYRSRILEKLKLNNNMQLTRYALERKLV
jgi:DNA-binding NarL/FixJ family response regulator